MVVVLSGASAATAGRLGVKSASRAERTTAAAQREPDPGVVAGKDV
jgi:hypothetical protein